MSNPISAKSYKKLTTHLLANLDPNGEFFTSYKHLVRAIGLSRTTIVLAVKKMREQDSEWEVTSGGNKPGQEVTDYTKYRYIGSK